MANISDALQVSTVRRSATGFTPLLRHVEHRNVQSALAQGGGQHRTSQALADQDDIMGV
jgi:hypothetical protein